MSNNVRKYDLFDSSFTQRSPNSDIDLIRAMTVASLPLNYNPFIQFSYYFSSEVFLRREVQFCAQKCF